MPSARRPRRNPWNGDRRLFYEIESSDPATWTSNWPLLEPTDPFELARFRHVSMFEFCVVHINCPAHVLPAVLFKLPVIRAMVNYFTHMSQEQRPEGHKALQVSIAVRYQHTHYGIPNSGGRKFNFPLYHVTVAGHHKGVIAGSAHLEARALAPRDPSQAVPDDFRVEHANVKSFVETLRWLNIRMEENGLKDERVASDPVLGSLLQGPRWWSEEDEEDSYPLAGVMEALPALEETFAVDEPYIWPDMSEKGGNGAGAHGKTMGNDPARFRAVSRGTQK